MQNIGLCHSVMYSPSFKAETLGCGQEVFTSWPQLTYLCKHQALAISVLGRWREADLQGKPSPVGKSQVLWRDPVSIS